MSVSCLVHVSGRSGGRVSRGVRPVRRPRIALPELLPRIPVRHCLQTPGEARLLGHATLHHSRPPHPGRSCPAVFQRLSELRPPVGRDTLPQGSANGWGPYHVTLISIKLSRNDVGTVLGGVKASQPMKDILLYRDGWHPVYV